jgi:hypothetical protein
MCGKRHRVRGRGIKGERKHRLYFEINNDIFK